MKNKSKLKKIRERKTKAPYVPAEWLYFAPADTALQQVYELFHEDVFLKAEYWEEAGALEIALPEAGSVDIECMDDDSLDDECREYAGQCGAKTVYAVTIVPEEYKKARAVMKRIMQNLGGFFCGDTENFQPEVGMEES